MTRPGAAIILPPGIATFAESLSRGDFDDVMPASLRDRLLDRTIGIIVAADMGDAAGVRELAGEVLEAIRRRRNGELPHDLAKLLASLEPEGEA